MQLAQSQCHSEKQTNKQLEHKKKRKKNYAQVTNLFTRMDARVAQGSVLKLLVLATLEDMNSLSDLSMNVVVRKRV